MSAHVKKSRVQSSTSIRSLATMATNALDDLEPKLDLDIVVRPNDKNQIRALGRVSPAALRLAADIVASAPERFPELSGIADGADYVEAMLPLANRAQTLATRIEKSIRNRRTPAAIQTLALYAVVKGLGRIADNEAMREKVAALKAELAPPRSKPKQTKEEKATKAAAKRRAGRVAKGLKLIAENGGAPPVTATPPAASPPRPTVIAPAATPSALAN